MSHVEASEESNRCEFNKEAPDQFTSTDHYTNDVLLVVKWESFDCFSSDLYHNNLHDNSDENDHQEHGVSENSAKHVELSFE